MYTYTYTLNTETFVAKNNSLHDCTAGIISFIRVPSLLDISPPLVPV